MLSRDQGDYSSFAVPDRPVRRRRRSGPRSSLTHLWRNSAGLTWQPLGMLTLSSDLASTRDLRVYSDSTSLGRLAYAGAALPARHPGGRRARPRRSPPRSASRPRSRSWLRPRLVTGSSFVLSRTLTSRQPVRATATAGRVHPAADAQQLARARDRRRRSTCRALLRLIAGDSSRVGRRVRPHPAGRPQRADQRGPPPTTSRPSTPA